MVPVVTIVLTRGERRNRLRPRALAAVLTVSLAAGGCTRKTAIGYGAVAVVAIGVVAISSSCPKSEGLGFEPCARGVAVGVAIGFGIAAVVSLLVGSGARAPAKPRAEPSDELGFSCARSGTNVARGVCGRGLDACTLLRSDAGRAGDELGPCEPTRTAFCFDLTGGGESCHPGSADCAAVRTARRLGECAARN